MYFSYRLFLCHWDHDSNVKSSKTENFQIYVLRWFCDQFSWQKKNTFSGWLIRSLREYQRNSNTMEILLIYGRKYSAKDKFENLGWKTILGLWCFKMAPNNTFHQTKNIFLPKANHDRLFTEQWVQLKSVKFMLIPMIYEPNKIYLLLFKSFSAKILLPPSV